MSNSIPKIIWFTGMSGAGKSFYGDYVAKKLKEKNLKIKILDGDVIREKYQVPLGFKYDEICTNNKNIANICREELNKYDVIIVAVISPYENVRQEIKKIFKNNIVFIYVYSDIESLKQRDTKGLYKNADEGIIKNLIGYSPGSIYEEPENCELILDTSYNIKPIDNYTKIDEFINLKVL